VMIFGHESKNRHKKQMGSPQSKGFWTVKETITE
jgi:hypothetical protein